jgi:hypothetical protein
VIAAAWLVALPERLRDGALRRGLIVPDRFADTRRHLQAQRAAI